MSVGCSLNLLSLELFGKASFSSLTKLQQEIVIEVFNLETAQTKILDSEIINKIKNQ